MYLRIDTTGRANSTVSPTTAHVTVHPQKTRDVGTEGTPQLMSSNDERNFPDLGRPKILSCDCKKNPKKTSDVSPSRPRIVVLSNATAAAARPPRARGGSRPSWLDDSLKATRGRGVHRVGEALCERVCIICLDPRQDSAILGVLKC